MTKHKAPLTHIIGQETEHARRLLQDMQKLLAENDNDDQFQSDLIEGETGLVEALDQVLLQLGSDLMAVEAINDHIDGLKNRQARIKERTEKIKTMIANAYELTGMTKPLHCPLATVSLRKVPDKLEIVDEEGIPDHLWFQPPLPDKCVDKKKLKEALREEQSILEDGQPLDIQEAVPGAMLVLQDKTLALRWK